MDPFPRRCAFKATRNWTHGFPSTRIVRSSVAALQSSNFPSVSNTQLDSILLEAANKHKLSHPAANSKERLLRKEEAKKVAPKSRISKQPLQRQRTPNHTLQKSEQLLQAPNSNDDALYGAITDSERDLVWQAIRQEVEGDGKEGYIWDDEQTSKGPPSLVRSTQASVRHNASKSDTCAPAAQPVANSSGFSGFGTPVTSTRTHKDTSANTCGSHPSTAHQLPHPQTQRADPEKPFRVFLYNAEEARTRALLEQLGWANRVVVVGDLRNADALLAAKLAKSGKHVNITQGERTAANGGIPFLVVGRHMTADNLRTTLAPLLEPHSPEAAVAAAKATDTLQKPTAAELQAQRLEVMQSFAKRVISAGPASA